MAIQRPLKNSKGGQAGNSPHPLLLPTNWYLRNVAFNSGYYLIDFFFWFDFKTAKIDITLDMFSLNFVCPPIPLIFKNPRFFPPQSVFSSNSHPLPEFLLK